MPNLKWLVIRCTKKLGFRRCSCVKIIALAAVFLFSTAGQAQETCEDAAEVSLLGFAPGNGASVSFTGTIDENTTNDINEETDIVCGSEGGLGDIRSMYPSSRLRKAWALDSNVKQLGS